MQKLKTKTIPCLVMLIGGLIAIVIASKNDFDMVRLLKTVLVTLLACYFVGTLVKIAVDKIEIEVPLDEEENEETDENESNEDNEERDEDEESFQEKAANLIRDMLIADETGEKRERYLGNATDEELYGITHGILLEDEEFEDEDDYGKETESSEDIAIDDREDRLLVREDAEAFDDDDL